MRWLRKLLSGKAKNEAAELANDRLDISQREAIERRLPLERSLEDNLDAIRTVVGPSKDLMIRQLKVGQGQIGTAVLHLEGLSDSSLVENIIRTLGLGTFQTPVGSASKRDIFDEFKQRLLQSSEGREVNTLDEVWDGLVNGNSAVIFDGTPKALICATQGFKTRAIEEPSAETVIRGPREGFIESISTNIALLRRRIKSPNLWVESFILGHLTRTDVAIAYIKGLASEELVQEVRQRVSRIQIDGIIESGDIENFIEDNPFAVSPLVFRTERVDRAVSMLLEGRVCIVTDGTPFVLVVPMSLPMLLQAPDDYYEKLPIGAFLRVLRHVAFTSSILLPGTYVAVLEFHQELLPTQLLLRITAAKEGVPFPVVSEVFMMELLFELLREAGIRLPRAIGPAVTIVGALVLGEAAIRAGLVSAPVVIIVALTAIASFTVPTFSFGIAARLTRFIFIILGGTFGLFGVQFGILVLVLLLASLRSFGYPFLSPMAPLVVRDLKDLYCRAWRWHMDTRPLLEGAREPVRQAKGQMPRPGIEKEETEKPGRGIGGKWRRRR